MASKRQTILDSMMWLTESAVKRFATMHWIIRCISQFPALFIINKRRKHGDSATQD
jgi:hypothetical protein